MVLINERFNYLFLIYLIHFNVFGNALRGWVTTDELESHISPDDLLKFQKMRNEDAVSSTTPAEDGVTVAEKSIVDCFGLGSTMKQLQRWFLNMKPDTVEKVNTHFYFYSRSKPNRAQVFPDEQFGLEWVDFKPNRKTVVIIHGFMSHSNASWVNDMARAFLNWKNVNVITVDWSGGGNTWKYWRAVANTRQVGKDVARFLNQVKNETGVNIKDFHYIGHSLGAHICAYVSYQLGGVSRITGLDPAQPCFNTENDIERLDKSDADFVDIIHTNGRLLSKIGFGLPDPIGHADFYPNGGMKQPGCHNHTKSIWSRLLPFSPSKLQQAICNHGRAYLLFTESLINNNCSFSAHRWNLTYEGVNASLKDSCDRVESCSEMGISAVGRHGMPRASGPYFVLTTEKEPYCSETWNLPSVLIHLLRDLRSGFHLDRTNASSTTAAYEDSNNDIEVTTNNIITSTTTKKSWWWPIG